MCGNNNGIAGDDAPVGRYGITWGNSQLFASQQVNGRQYLFDWFPPASSAATLPPYAELCPAIDPAYVPPILNNPG